MKQGNSISEIYEWPYQIHYDRVNRIAVDVLVIGGGISGAAAGIAAARRGVKVAVVDKAPIKRSGCGGAGLDHWNSCISNPDCPVTPEEYMDLPAEKTGLEHRTYISVKGSWEALMELEKLGMPLRDDDNDFESAPTRDEKSKILKGFDYQNLVNIKMRGGHYIKPTLYEGLKKEGAALYERVMMTGLLTEGGKPGARVVGAMGFSMETGEFYVFSAKSVILTSGPIGSIWIYSTEITGQSFRWDPNDIGDGFAMAWKIGAQTVNMDRAGSTRGSHPFAWPRFGIGNPDNTWFPCTIVDNNGKEIPWEDVNGNPVTSIEARNMPVEGQVYINSSNDRLSGVRKPLLIYDLPERIRKGEYELPLWADLSGMPEQERRSIWGVMIGNEGKTRYTLYDYYTRLGFDPDKDMLMCPIMLPENYVGSSRASTRHDWFQGEQNAVKPWRSEVGGQGDLPVDWNFMTNIEGLFAAGAVSGTAGASQGASTGFYAGNRAAEKAAALTRGAICEAQVEAERQRVCAPLDRVDDPSCYVSWKELWGGIARAMQQCCGEYKTISILEQGLLWLESIQNTEMQMTYARNPHELARVMECATRLTVSQAYLHGCIEKIKALDNGLKKGEFVFVKLENGRIATEIKERKYWLKPPYAPAYLENYNRCREMETGRSRNTNA